MKKKTYTQPNVAVEKEHEPYYKTLVKSGYAPVNSLKIYYEIHGAAGDMNPTLVLLHGGGSTIETSFGKVLPSFAKTRQVIAFEQQGYGHTADIETGKSGSACLWVWESFTFNFISTICVRFCRVWAPAK